MFENYQSIRNLNKKKNGEYDSIESEDPSTEPKDLMPRRYQRMCSIKDAQFQLNLSHLRLSSTESVKIQEIASTKRDAHVSDAFALTALRLQTESSSYSFQQQAPKIDQVEANTLTTNKDSILNTDLKIFTALDEIKSELTETKLMLKIIKEHQFNHFK